MCLLMIVDLLMHIYCVDSCGVALFEHGACTTCHVFLVALRAACSVAVCDRSHLCLVPRWGL